MFMLNYNSFLGPHNCQQWGRLGWKILWLLISVGISVMIFLRSACCLQGPLYPATRQQIKLSRLPDHLPGRLSGARHCSGISKHWVHKFTVVPSKKARNNLKLVLSRVNKFLQTLKKPDVEHYTCFKTYTVFYIIFPILLHLHFLYLVQCQQLIH